jgi:hypothetical protein
MPLTQSQKGYLAGIIDGEGSIMLQRTGGYVFPVVKVANTNPALSRWLSDVTGVGHVQYHSRLHRDCKDVEHWTVASNQAITLLEAVRDHLVLKQAQCDAVLALAAENRAAVALTGRKAFGHGNSVPAWLWHFREALYFHLRNLNQRGIAPWRFADEVRYHMRRVTEEEALPCP